jgi:hypothetical protein
MNSKQLDLMLDGRKFVYIPDYFPDDYFTASVNGVESVRVLRPFRIIDHSSKGHNYVYWECENLHSQRFFVRKQTGGPILRRVDQCFVCNFIGRYTTSNGELVFMLNEKEFKGWHLQNSAPPRPISFEEFTQEA